MIADHMFEGFSIQEFHDDERMAVLLADVINRADVCVIECGRSFSFTSESFQGLRIAREIFWKKLQGDEAIEASVLGFEDDTHPATAEFLNDAVVRDGLADHRRNATWRGSG